MFLKQNSILEIPQTIKKIRSLGPIPEGAILCTLAVSSLHTNIPNQEGISDPTKTPITQFILDLLTLVFHNMNFEFNGEHYLQIGGKLWGHPRHQIIPIDYG